MQADDQKEELEASSKDYLMELDLRLQQSSTPYFDSSNQPRKAIDLEIYNELKMNNWKPTTQHHPHLFSWFDLMGLFSEEVIEKWVQ